MAGGRPPSSTPRPAPKPVHCLCPATRGSHERFPATPGRRRLASAFGQHLIVGVHTNDLLEVGSQEQDE